MSLIQAIVLGILQGLTEFLPVSSSGHLAILKNIFHLELDSGMLYDVLLHVATLVTICIVFFKDVVKLIIEFIMIVIDLCKNIGIFFQNTFAHKNQKYIKITQKTYRKFVVMLIVSTIPTGILGYLMQDIVEKAGLSLLIPGICLLVTGGILFITDMAETGKKKPKDATMFDAFTVGMCQGIATLPGLSRSGTTVAACLLCGFDRKFAVKYSFIMSIPAIIGALILQLGKVATVSIKTIEIVYYVIGMLIAAAVGFVCIKVMIAIVQSKRFKGFAFYCMAIGAISIICFLVQL